MKLLFVRFSSIGDIVVITPAIRCAKQQIPGVEIHLLTKLKFRFVTEGNPNIDKFHYYEDDLGDVIRQLRKENFDHVIDLQDNLRSLRVRLTVGKKNFTFRKLSLEKMLLVKFRVNVLTNRHIALRALDALESLGVRDDGEGMDYFLPPATGNGNNPLPEFTRGGYIAVVIGATHFTKRMPPQRLAELCRMISLPIVLVGGKEEVAAGEIIAAANPNNVFNACGLYSLHGSAILVRDARFVISHDTGLQHIACAFRKRVMVIWGGTSPALLFGPYYGQKHEIPFRNFLLEGLSCQPCSLHGTKKCPEGHFNCMLKLDLNPIANTARAWWSQ
jgi:ADP-heptose:LPS heptosyltransferase